MGSCTQCRQVRVISAQADILGMRWTLDSSMRGKDEGGAKATALGLPHPAFSQAKIRADGSSIVTMVPCPDSLLRLIWPA